MAMPQRPYCTINDVTRLLQGTFFGGTPGPTTIPTGNIVSELIDWTDSVIDTVLFSIGYQVPLRPHPVHEWTESNTKFLSFLSALGTASLITGYILSPVPSRGKMREGGEENVFAVLFENFRERIVKGEIAIPAEARNGTLADKVLSQHDPPYFQICDDIIGTLRDYSNLKYLLFSYGNTE